MILKELYIQQSYSGLEISLLENKELKEYHTAVSNSKFQVGDFYLGKIKKIIPAMNAAFVDIGYEKDGFLHFADLGPNISSVLAFTKELTEGRRVNFSNFLIEKDSSIKGSISEILKSKFFLLVQIMKEPILNKGPRLTCDFSISGRNVVLTPFGNTINISKKVHLAEERKRLLKIAEELKGKNWGIIVRTAAENKGTEEIKEDIKYLLNFWNIIQNNLLNAVPPVRIKGEVSKVNSLLRDLLSDKFSSIVVDNKNLEIKIKNFLKKIAPEKIDILKCIIQKESIFDTFNITKQIKKLFGKHVYLSSGVYLIIEKTEALHVIDVNSGTKANSNNQEDNALQSNLEAVEEIARQLRLRDLGGIIVIDFIDVKSAENKKKIYDKLLNLMSTDRARHQILPLSKFSIMQITRQRIRPEVDLDVQELCPTCKGGGKISPIINIEDEIKKSLEYVLLHNHRKILITVHPIIQSYLNSGLISKRIKWIFKYKKIIRIKSNKNIPFNSYSIYDENDEEIVQR